VITAAITAKFESNLRCGHHIQAGDRISKPPGAGNWMCLPCASRWTQPHQWLLENLPERLLADPKVQALLVLAVATSNDHEAAAALTAARRIVARKKRARE